MSTNILDIQCELAHHGLHLRLRKGRIEVVGPKDRLTPDLRTRLIEARDDLYGLFGQSPPQASGEAPSRPSRWLLSLGGEQIPYGVWDGQDLGKGPIALDVETEVIRANEVPRLALIQVSNGQEHFLIHTDHGADFLQLHAASHIVGHNLAFDIAVLLNAYPSCGVPWEIVEDGRAHDTMFLDMLIRLAKRDEYPNPRSLAEVAHHYCDLRVAKDDPYRLRYREIIGKPLEAIGRGFRDYAIKDAIVTWRVWKREEAIARAIIRRHKGEYDAGMIDRYGLLTENLQLRAAIALADIERRGLRIDLACVRAARRVFKRQIDGLVSDIDSLDGFNIFKRDREGKLKRSEKSYKPTRSNEALQQILERIEAQNGLTISRTPKRGTISTSTKKWAEHQGLDPFLSSWVQLDEQAKLYQFFSGLREPVIHPRYTTLVRSGRTSCHGPNIQQLPRAGGFREMVIPSPGHVFLAIDYSYVELRTLAAVCLDRFGYSQLAEVMREGTDPHVYTAANFAGLSLQEFNALPKEERKALRQKAKALNFGIPGLLGARSLVTYARQSYGVELTEEEATDFREKHINEVYPELAEYLQEDLAVILAENLRTTPESVRAAFPDEISLLAARKIVRGECRTAKGKAYRKGYVDAVWRKLTALNRNSSLTKRLTLRRTGDRTVKRLFWGSAVTRTGRIRGRVSFSRRCNTRFQGLAADGAKLALWRLYRAGYRVVAFIHDEVLLELPVDADHTAEAKRIDEILCGSMAEVVGTVPIACEYSLSRRWSKGAEAVFDGDGRLLIWEPKDGQ